MNTPTKITIPPEFAPTYVPYSYRGQPVKGAFGANTRPAFVKASDRAYFEADKTLSDAMRQLLIAMDVLDTGAGVKPVGDFNYCNIKARRGQSGRFGKDDVEGSLDPYANYANHVDFARAKLTLIQHPRWGVNLATDTPSEVIDKIEGTPIVWGTLFSPAAQRALETGRGIDDLTLDYEKAIVKRYRALGITDIQSARKKYYCEKMTAIGRQVGLMMAGGDPNVTYTPDFERKATPIEPPVVPPIRPLDPAAPTVPPQPTLVQGLTPLTPKAFDALAFTRKTTARLIDGRAVYVTAVDFARREVRYSNQNDNPIWVGLDKVTAIV